MKKELIIKVFVFLIIFILAWNILDFLYATFISKSPFIFNVRDSLVEPLVPGVIFAIFLNVLPDNRNKKK